MNEPSVFIGSASESKEIAEYLQIALDDYCETTIWDQGTFGLSSMVLNDLINTAQTADFAILICSADDRLTRRGAEFEVPRDNITFETGFFIGALGLDRTFLVACKEDAVTLPTDLAGITVVEFRKRSSRNSRAAINPVAVKIREAIQKGGRKRESVIVDKPEDRITTLCYRNVMDILTSLREGYAGISTGEIDEKRFSRWAESIVGMAYEHFSERSNDVYALWLRPISQKNILEPFIGKNFKDDESHYNFGLGEGLVGKIWKNGGAASVSRVKEHPWWVHREGCENMSYVCAAVGETSGPGGVLAIGSDKRFSIESNDEYLIAMYASVLALGCKNSKTPDGNG